MTKLNIIKNKIKEEKEKEEEFIKSTEEYNNIFNDLNKRLELITNKQLELISKEKPRNVSPITDNPETNIDSTYHAPLVLILNSDSDSDSDSDSEYCLTPESSKSSELEYTII